MTEETPNPTPAAGDPAGAPSSQDQEAPAAPGGVATADAPAAGLTLGGSAAADASEEPQEPEVDPTGRVAEPGRDGYLWGTGRRKEAVARVRVRLGSGRFEVNGKEMKDFFSRDVDRQTCLAPLRLLQVRKKVDVFVTTHGGGITGQAGAIRMGLGRALSRLYPDAERTLREHGHLTRDPRMVERKKLGFHKARRGQQWGKR